MGAHPYRTYRGPPLGIWLVISIYLAPPIHSAPYLWGLGVWWKVVGIPPLANYVRKWLLPPTAQNKKFDVFLSSCDGWTEWKNLFSHEFHQPKCRGLGSKGGRSYIMEKSTCAMSWVDTIFLTQKSIFVSRKLCQSKKWRKRNINWVFVKPQMPWAMDFRPKAPWTLRMNEPLLDTRFLTQMGTRLKRRNSAHPNIWSWHK